MSRYRSDFDYYAYIRSPEWRAKADLAKARAGWRCQLCYGTGPLEAHHRTYERLGNELPSDITVLCSECHKRHHGKLPALPPKIEAIQTGAVIPAVMPKVDPIATISLVSKPVPVKRGENIVVQVPKEFALIAAPKVERSRAWGVLLMIALASFMLVVIGVVFGG